MVVILCNSFEDAQECFAFFMDFLETYEPQSISRVFEYSYGVETDEDLRYIFIDKRMEHLFDHVKPDIIWQADFFEGIDNGYFNKWR